MSVQLKRLMEKHKDKIASISIETHHRYKIGGDFDGHPGHDGYWIYLRKGWCSSAGCHSVHEWTVKDTLDAFKWIERCEPGCDCDEWETVGNPWTGFAEGLGGKVTRNE